MPWQESSEPASSRIRVRVNPAPIPNVNASKEKMGPKIVGRTPKKKPAEPQWKETWSPRPSTKNI